MLYKYIHSVTYEIADYALISIDFSTIRQMKDEEEEVYTIIQFFPGVISNLELTNKSSMTHTYQTIPNVFADKGLEINTHAPSYVVLDLILPYQSEHIF